MHRKNQKSKYIVVCIPISICMIIFSFNFSIIVINLVFIIVYTRKSFSTIQKKKSFCISHFGKSSQSTDMRVANTPNRYTYENYRKIHYTKRFSLYESSRRHILYMDIVYALYILSEYYISRLYFLYVLYIYKFVYMGIDVYHIWINYMMYIV